MRHFSILTLMTLFFLAFTQDKATIRDFFFGIDAGDFHSYSYKEVCKRNDLKVLTTKEGFRQSNEYTAKYLKTSSIYLKADSIYFYMLPSFDFGALDNSGTIDKSKTRDLVEIKVLEYVHDTATLNKEYNRLLDKIQTTLLKDNPKWTNHSGTSKGVFFITAADYPILIIDKNNFKKDNLSVCLTIDDLVDKTSH